WYALQQQLLESIDQSFLDVAKLQAPLLDREPIGINALSEMAHRIFAEKCPDDILSSANTVSLTRVDEKYQLSFWLPNVEQSNLDARRKNMELILTAGSYTRVFSLPNTLVEREIAEAKFDDDILTITFD
ncbi:MAG: hypothetical protein JSV16_09135, partial [Candidatus Hydrogenedentota bacterium]